MTVAELRPGFGAAQAATRAVSNRPEMRGRTGSSKKETRRSPATEHDGQLIQRRWGGTFAVQESTCDLRDVVVNDVDSGGDA
jgi:hypothetical protein